MDTLLAFILVINKISLSVIKMLLKVNLKYFVVCAAGYHRNGGTKNNANGNSNSCMACPTGTWSSIDAADDSECNSAFLTCFNCKIRMKAVQEVKFERRIKNQFY